MGDRARPGPVRRYGGGSSRDFHQENRDNPHAGSAVLSRVRGISAGLLQNQRFHLPSAPSLLLLLDISEAVEAGDVKAKGVETEA